jgi:hypothetical protein
MDSRVPEVCDLDEFVKGQIDRGIEANKEYLSVRRNDLAKPFCSLRPMHKSSTVE